MTTNDRSAYPPFDRCSDYWPDFLAALLGGQPTAITEPVSAGSSSYLNLNFCARSDLSLVAVCRHETMNKKPMKITSQSYPSSEAQPTKFIVSGLGATHLELYPTRSEDGSLKLDYTPSDLADGEYQVQAVAVGNNLSSNASEPVTVTVKNSPPAVPTLSIQ